MKKTILIISLLILLGGGCSTKTPSVTPITNSEINITTKAQTSTTTTNTIKQTTMTSTAKNDTKTATSAIDLLKQYDQVILKTTLGDITVQLYNSDSPNTVKNFLTLTQKDFYNNTQFHRVIKDFMIQGGDPLSKESNRLKHGTGGPGYKFNDEFNKHKLVKGSLAMANSGPNTNGSQFFIVTKSATPWLDGMHTNFGYVIAGMSVVEKIEEVTVDSRDNPVEAIVIKSTVLQHSK